MSKHILKTMRLPMTAKDQDHIYRSADKAWKNSSCRSIGILCQPSIQAKEWQVAIVSSALYEKVQAILDEAKK